MRQLEVAGCAVLVVGGGASAGTAVAQLIAAGASVTVVAGGLVASLTDLVERGLIRHSLATTDELIMAAALVVAASAVSDSADTSDSADVGEHLAERCRALGRPLQWWGPSGPTKPRKDDDHPGGPARQPGEVILVGGGPGEPGLITVAGLAAIRRADVIITDRLAPLAVIAEAPDHAEIIDVGKIPRGQTTPQTEINRLLIEHAGRAHTVVRLKGGDGFVFGRGGEEWQACAAAGVPVTVLPGVSAAIGVPGLAGIPVTHRELVQGFTVITGHLRPGHPGSTLDWAALARAGTTLVIMMGVATLPAITEELIRHGMVPELPAATIADGGLPSQLIVRGTLATIASLSDDADVKPPAVTIVGAVAGLNLTSHAHP